MDTHEFREATPRQVDRLARTLVATRVFADAEELETVRLADPWRIQASERGDVAVLGIWRDHLPILAIQALWCPARAIPGAVTRFLDMGRERGLTDVVTPPTPVEEMRAYQAAGMRPHTIVATLTLTKLSEAGEAPAITGLALRPAGHLDIPTLLEVDRQSFEPFWRYDATHLDRFCSTGRLVVGEREGEAVGYTLCTVDRGEGMLGRLCVAPAFRRQGVGTALLFDAIRYVREQGGERLTLSTQADNAPSQALYRSAHFRDTGRRYAFLRFGTDEG